MSQLPPEFDEFQSSDYDPQYTADISMHMHVPDHLDVTGDDDSVAPVYVDDRLNTHVAHMTVPDKIIVVGMLLSDCLIWKSASACTLKLNFRI